MMANITILLRFFLILSSNLILFKRTAKLVWIQENRYGR